MSKSYPMLLVLFFTSPTRANCQKTKWRLHKGNTDTLSRMSNLRLSARELKRATDWTLGLLMLGSVVLLWVMSSFLVNSLFDDENNYNKPFFITYINTSVFSLYLIPYYWNYRKEKNGIISAERHKPLIVETFVRPDHHSRRQNNNKHHHMEVPVTEVATASYEIRSLGSDQYSSVMPEEGSTSLMSLNSPHSNKSALSTTPLSASVSRMSLRPLTIKETIFLSSWFCSLWFVSNLATNASLVYTSVSSQTILASTSSFFTIIVGYTLGASVLTSKKAVALLISFIGVILVTHNDSPEQTRDSQGGWNNKYILFGNLLALLGALCYGIYSILLKLKVKNEDRMDMKLFFGFVGVFNIIFLWPPLVVLHYLDIETFELPPDSKVYSIVLFNCFISFLADFFWAKAMLLTSPLTVTVGLSLTIPVAMVGDFFIKHKVNSFIYMFGAVMICGSFFIINKDEYDDSDSINNRNVHDEEVDNDVRIGNIII